MILALAGVRDWHELFVNRNAGHGRAMHYCSGNSRTVFSFLIFFPTFCFRLKKRFSNDLLPTGFISYLPCLLFLVAKGAFSLCF